MQKCVDQCNHSFFLHLLYFITLLSCNLVIFCLIVVFYLFFKYKILIHFYFIFFIFLLLFSIARLEWRLSQLTGHHPIAGHICTIFNYTHTKGKNFQWSYNCFFLATAWIQPWSNGLWDCCCCFVFFCLFWRGGAFLGFYFRYLDPLNEVAVKECPTKCNPNPVAYVARGVRLRHLKEWNFVVLNWATCIASHETRHDHGGFTEGIFWLGSARSPELLSRTRMGSQASPD